MNTNNQKTDDDFALIVSAGIETEKGKRIDCRPRRALIVSAGIETKVLKGKRWMSKRL